MSSQRSSNNQASQPSNNSGGSSGNSRASTNTDWPSTNQMIRMGGWDNRAHFQASYGLSMGPDDLEEGKAILEGYKAIVRQERMENEKRNE